MEVRGKVWLLDLNNLVVLAAPLGPVGGGPLSALGPVGMVPEIILGDEFTPDVAFGPVGIEFTGLGDTVGPTGLTNES